MILVILYLMTQSDSFSDSLPIITLYAFAAYRLIPALQSMYAAITQLRFSEPAVVSLHSDLAGLTPTKQSHSRDPLPLEKAIQLNNIHYYYPNSTEPVLKGINLKIPSKSMIGLVGTTGSGKTTVVDLILGLLEPTQGSLEVDGQSIDKQNRHAWQRSIGYVPQQTTLYLQT
jgi:ABC-type bacteriocin/lantibiotic exporter with double-glycine peptidase domain